MNSTDNSVLKCSCYVTGVKVHSGRELAVKSPYDGRVVGLLELAGQADVQKAIAQALAGGKKLTRYERFTILEKTRQLLMERQESFANMISAESGLAIREARYETGRAHDVLLFAA